MIVSHRWLGWSLLVVSAVILSPSGTDAQILRRNRRGYSNQNYNNQNCSNCNQNNNSQTASYLAPGEILLSESAAQPASASSVNYDSSSVVAATESPVADAIQVVSSSSAVSYPQTVAQSAAYAEPNSAYVQQASFAQPIASTSNSTGGYRPMPAFTHSFGTQPHDIGYIGPGDMRTHLWREHGSDLSAAGMDYHRVMSLSAAAAQSWHNYFHGAESNPPM